MAIVVKSDDGSWVLTVQRGIFKKNAKLKAKPRSSFFVSFMERVWFINGKRKVYKYPFVSIGNMDVAVPKELKGRKIRFVMQLFNPRTGEWEFKEKRKGDEE